MVTRGPMVRAVASALRTAPTLPRDAGAVALAKRYAALIDESAPERKYATALRVLARAVDPDDQEAMEAYRRVADALAEHSVASDLGPKLLAALTALGMTAAGRSAKGGAADGPRVADELAALRQRAAARRRGAGAD